MRGQTFFEPQQQDEVDVDCAMPKAAQNSAGLRSLSVSSWFGLRADSTSSTDLKRGDTASSQDLKPDGVGADNRLFDTPKSVRMKSPTVIHRRPGLLDKSARFEAESDPTTAESPLRDLQKSVSWSVATVVKEGKLLLLINI